MEAKYKVDYAYKDDDVIYTAKFRTNVAMVNFVRILRPDLGYYEKYYWDNLRDEWRAYVAMGVPPSDRHISAKDLKRLAHQAYWTGSNEYIKLINEWRDCLPHTTLADPLSQSRGCWLTINKLDKESLNDLVNQLERIVRHERPSKIQKVS